MKLGKSLLRSLTASTVIISIAVYATSCGASSESPSGGFSSSASVSSGNSSSSSSGNSMVTAAFLPSFAEIPNPERGFYRWARTDLTQFSQADGTEAYSTGYRLLYAIVHLDSYKSTPLPQTLLDKLRTGFGNARRTGIKIIPRFVYNYPAGETDYKNAADAPVDQVLAHIAQLKPVLQENADVIAFLQAGFIGAWGEWHTSSNHLTDEANRTRIRDALLDALPQDHFVQFRYPPYLIAWTPTAPTQAQAFDGTPASRSGMHNDCFLASATDVGTYSADSTEAQQQRAYAMALGKVAPFGGETCNPAAEPSAQSRTSCNDILTEGLQYSLTYLNGDYYVDAFHNRWKADGCYDEVKRLMGYRLELVSAEHSKSAVAGSPSGLRFKISVRNVGWARIFNPRLVTIVLKNKSTGEIVKINTSIDPRMWTSGSTFVNEVLLTVPSGTSPGEYEVFVSLPDAAPSLTNDARYNIQPANADNVAANQAWDSSLGAFRLGTTLAIM